MQPLQQLPNRSIVRNRVRHGRDGMEPENPILVAAYNASPVRLDPSRMLHIIMACGVRLPDINLNVGDRPALCILQGANNKQRLALWVMREGFSRRDLVGVVCVERA